MIVMFTFYCMKTISAFSSCSWNEIIWTTHKSERVGKFDWIWLTSHTVIQTKSKSNNCSGILTIKKLEPLSTLHILCSCINVCYFDTSRYIMYSHGLAYLCRWFAQAFVTPHETQRWTFHERHFTKYEFPQLNCSFWKNSHFSVSLVLIYHSHKSFNHRINNAIAILCI